MKIRINEITEKFAHRWYARFAGCEFEVINISYWVAENIRIPATYTVSTIPLQETGESLHSFDWVVASHATIVDNTGTARTPGRI